jgi:hypothetical protein
MCVWTSGNSRKNAFLQELREVRGAC